MDPEQLREIIRTICRLLFREDDRETSWDAVELILATIAQESACGRYLRQIGGGPALGIIQMEPATERDIWKHFIAYRSDITSSMIDLGGYVGPDHWKLMTDISYQIAMCRMHYRRVNEALPRREDVMAMARYWKRHYNTAAGAGTVEEFIKSYDRYVVKQKK